MARLSPRKPLPRERPEEAGEVRIIAGHWRSRRIAFPGAPGLRPTPDRVRETLFNWLGHDLSGFRCLDLYAGSGVLGFEALSRGAERVVMVERSPAVVRALESSAQRLMAPEDKDRLKIVRADALEFLKREDMTTGNVRFDVIFLDPPFGDGVPTEVVESLPGLLAKSAVVYVESPSEVSWPAPWVRVKQGKAGQVHFQLLGWDAA